MPYDVSNGAINGSDCSTQRWDPDPWLVIDFGHAVTLDKVVVRLGHWHRIGKPAGTKFALMNDVNNPGDTVWSGEIQSDYYHTPGYQSVH